MADRPLLTVTRTQGNNRALKEGLVAPERHALTFEEVPVLVQAFRRMVREQTYDVSEMAATTYLVAKAHGAPLTALPVFLVRGFHHGAIVVRRGGDVTEPKDLAGRRVGVSRGYTVTTGVWARGILHDEYGLDLDTVTWARSGDEHVAAYRPPANVESLPPGCSLEDLVASGELDAAVGIEADGRSLVPLIPDAAGAGYAALRARGHYPINHLVVVRDDLLAKDPDLAGDLFDAFRRSKERYVDALRAGTIEQPTRVDRMHAQVMNITGRDPLPYGIEPNRAVLDELIRHALDQHILDAAPDLPALFAAGARDLVG
jgi:4,5-dihydroxyphthalate decarboxylase